VIDATTNTATCPSPVRVVVRSVPHIVSTVSGMVVPSCVRPPRPRPTPPEAVVPVLIVALPRITSAVCRRAPKRAVSLQIGDDHPSLIARLRLAN
jgi:hypothetical protein